MASQSQNSTAELLAGTDRLLITGAKALHDIQAGRALTDERVRASRASIKESYEVLEYWNRLESML